eukprot:gene5208-18436_t
MQDEIAQGSDSKLRSPASTIRHITTKIEGLATNDEVQSAMTKVTTVGKERAADARQTEDRLIQPDAEIARLRKQYIDRKRQHVIHASSESCIQAADIVASGLGEYLSLLSSSFRAPIFVARVVNQNFTKDDILELNDYNEYLMDC